MAARAELKGGVRVHFVEDELKVLKEYLGFRDQVWVDAGTMEIRRGRQCGDKLEEALCLGWGSIRRAGRGQDSRWGLGEPGAGASGRHWTPRGDDAQGPGERLTWEQVRATCARVTQVRALLGSLFSKEECLSTVTDSVAEPEGGSTREGVPTWGTRCVLRGLSRGLRRDSRPWCCSG